MATRAERATEFRGPIWPYSERPGVSLWGSRLKAKGFGDGLANDGKPVSYPHRAIPKAGGLEVGVPKRGISRLGGPLPPAPCKNMSRMGSDFGGNPRPSETPMMFSFVQQSKTENRVALKFSLLASRQRLTAISEGDATHFFGRIHATRPLGRGTPCPRRSLGFMIYEL